MLFKFLRVTLAILFFTILTFFFLDFASLTPLYLHWLAHIQIVPALLAGMVGVIAFWIVTTFLFGRVYCSVICPLGVIEDIFSRMAKWTRGKKWKFQYKVSHRKTRLIVLAVFVIGLLTHLPIFFSLLDPYSIYGRITTSLLRPFYLRGNNEIATQLQNAGNYYLYLMPIILSLETVIVSLLTLGLIGYLSLRFGRRYCNMICPVGTLLGFISRFSLFKITLHSNCIGCKLCESACKSECIDSKAKTVDSSRCVVCFNCLSTCKRGSLSYQFSSQLLPILSRNEIKEPEPQQTERRRLMFASLFALFLPSLGAAPSSHSSSVPSTLPQGTSRISYKQTHPIVPPGGRNRKHFQKHCTACHLCVSKCPAGIITPSITDLGPSGFLQPVLKYRHGFCNFDCTVCTEICPNHALEKLTINEKHLLQVGRVVFLVENCVVNTQGSNCGACAEHCPTGAVKMVPHGDPTLALTIPEITPDLCVGCGACEYICPVRPFRAIYVDGVPDHLKALPAFDPNEKQQEIKVEDFGF